MPRYHDDRPGIFGYLLRLIVILVVLAAIGLVGFAYFGDLSPVTEARSIPIELGGN
ncbi:MAG: hypothetical protein R3D60_11060 [Paracoccaceae bacterium]